MANTSGCLVLHSIYHVWRGIKCEVGRISSAKQLISDASWIYQLNQHDLRLIYQQEPTMCLAEHSVLWVDAPCRPPRTAKKHSYLIQASFHRFIYQYLQALHQL